MRYRHVLRTYCLRNHHNHHWAAVVLSGWVKVPACRLQVVLSLATLCQIVTIQHLSRSSLHHLARLSCHMFVAYGLLVVIPEVHRSSLRRLMCSVHGHFIFITLLIIILLWMTCPLPGPDVGLSILCMRC